MKRILAALFGLLLVGIGLSRAAVLEVKIKDQGGRPIEGVIIEAFAENDSPVSFTRQTIIDQINKEFVPTVTVITAGTGINFPNWDDIRHHVYSFSTAKQFELPLYSGTPANPVIFDQSGIVVLGCNIHDWMRAYVYIAESERYIRTDTEGFGKFEDLANGTYKVKLWHPTLRKKKTPVIKTMVLTNEEVEVLDATLILKPTFRIRRSPTRRIRAY